MGFGDANTKKRKFRESVELQIGLKQYDPQKDKRFSGSVRLPRIPRPNMTVCILGEAQQPLDERGGPEEAQQEQEARQEARAEVPRLPRLRGPDQDDPPSLGPR